MLSTVDCPKCKKPTVVIWEIEAENRPVYGCNECVDTAARFLAEGAKLHFCPKIEVGEDACRVSPNPGVDFVFVRRYLEFCTEPDPPIDRAFLLSEVYELIEVFKVLKTLACNEVQSRALKRLGKVLKDLIDGKRIVATHRLPWRFLPPGKTGIQRAVAHFRRVREFCPEVRIDEERLKFMETLNADRTFLGQDSFEGYICFYYDDEELAVLECPYYGNAVYILKRNWQALSKHSKTELLNYFSDSIEQIRHTANFVWYLRRALRRYGINE